MILLIKQLFIQLETAQASLIIYLFSTALLLLSVLITIHYRAQIQAGLSRRLIVGLLFMLIVEMAALAANILLRADPVIATTWLPPLDRFQMAFLVLWLLWIWAFPEPSAWLDALAIIFTITGGLAFILTVNLWSISGLSVSFNASWLDLVWQLACLSYLILIVIAIYLRRPSLWGIGLLMGLSFLFGHLLQILLPNLSADYPGPVRFFVLMALPLLLFLPVRFINSPSAAHNAGLRRGPDKRERRRFSTELPTAIGYLGLAQEDDPQAAMQQLVKSIGQTLLADVCMFTTGPNQSGQVTILAGYDFHNHQEIDETRLEHQRIPLVANVLSTSKSLRLSEDYKDSPDIPTLCRLIKHDGKSPLLIHPVNKLNAWQLGGILLMTPYSRRPWTEEDSAYVTRLTEEILRYIDHNQSILEASRNIQNLVESQRESGQIIIDLQNELEELHNRLDIAESELSMLDDLDIARHSGSASKDGNKVQPFTFHSRKGPKWDATLPLDPRVVEESDARREITRLQDENNSLHQLIEQISIGAEIPSNQPGAQVETELRLSLEEVARLRNMLADADMKIRQLSRDLKGNA